MRTAPCVAAILLAGGCAEPFDGETRGTTYTGCDGCLSTPSSSTTVDTVYYAAIGADGSIGVIQSWQFDVALQLERLDDVDDNGSFDVLVDGEWVLAGAPGSAFSRFTSADAHELGDIDGDGRSEFTLDDGVDVSVVPGAAVTEGSAPTLADGWPVQSPAQGSRAPDVDRDGRADVIWATDQGTRLRLVLGADVAGAVDLDAAVADWTVGGNAASETYDAGDVDGDGVNDLAVSTPYDLEILLAFHSGAALATGDTAAFAELTVPMDLYDVHAPLVVVPMGDLDLNGRMDLAIAISGTSRDVGRIVDAAELVSGPLAGLGDPIPRYHDFSQISGVDLDEDGFSELVVENGGEISVFTGADLAAGLTQPAWTFGGTSATLAAADGELLYAFLR